MPEHLQLSPLYRDEALYRRLFDGLASIHFFLWSQQVDVEVRRHQIHQVLVQVEGPRAPLGHLSVYFTTVI